MFLSGPVLRSHKPENMQTCIATFTPANAVRAVFFKGIVFGFLKKKIMVNVRLIFFFKFQTLFVLNEANWQFSDLVSRTRSSDKQYKQETLAVFFTVTDSNV